MEKLKIPYAIVVEGKYDKIKLSNVCEARILTTDGFGIFKKDEKLALIRKLASELPVIVLTDSDGAGKLIRAHLSSAIPREKIIQLYIPQIAGKEKRKNAPSAEGTLGVEGIDDAVLYGILKPYEDAKRYKRYSENPITKADFYEDGLMGREDSSLKRDGLCSLLGLPRGMTSNALFETVKILLTYEEYKECVKKLAK